MFYVKMEALFTCPTAAFHWDREIKLKIFSHLGAEFHNIEKYHILPVGFDSTM